MLPLSIFEPFTHTGVFSNGIGGPIFPDTKLLSGSSCNDYLGWYLLIEIYLTT